mgnify:CR=1 FL=1
MSDRIITKEWYDFYYYLFSLQSKQDWKWFAETLDGLPDVSEDLTGLRKVTHQQYESNDQTVEKYIEKTSEYVLNLTFKCFPILCKINHYLKKHFYKTYIPRTIPDLEKNVAAGEVFRINYEDSAFATQRVESEYACKALRDLHLSGVKRKSLENYHYMVKEIQSFQHRLQLYCFFRMIRDLLRKEGENNPILETMFVHTDACLHKTRDYAVWKRELDAYANTIHPLLLDLERNHAELYHVLHSLFQHNVSNL